MPLTRPLLATALALPFALSPGGPALSQDLAAYQAANAAALAAWEDMPLGFLTTGLIERPAGGFGLYDLRANAIFAPGEPIHTYAEPVGFAWQENDDGTYSFGLQVDLVLKDSEGAILVEREQFQRYIMTSRVRNREFFISLQLDLTDAPEGDYVLDYIIRDLARDQRATISQSITIAAN